MTHITNSQGKVLAAHEDGDEYDITGVDVYGKRFKMTYTNLRYALGINLYRGTVWQRKKDETNRKVLYRVWN